MISPKLLALALPAAALVAGCGSSGQSSQAMPQDPGAQTAAAAPAPAASGPAVRSAGVTIKSFQFGPATTIVKKGGRVTWRNVDSAEHTATADDRSFDSQTIAIGKSRSVTFTSAGTFHYHCDFHPFMKGTIVVR